MGALKHTNTFWNNFLAREQIVLCLCQMNVLAEFCVTYNGHGNILVNRQHMLPGRCAGAAASATGPPQPLPVTTPHSHTPTSLHPAHTHTHTVFTNLFVSPLVSKKKQTATSQTHQDADKLLLFHPGGRDDAAPLLPFSLGQMRPPLAHLEGRSFFYLFFFFSLQASEVSRPPSCAPLLSPLQV